MTAVVAATVVAVQQVSPSFVRNHVLRLRGYDQSRLRPADQDPAGARGPGATGSASKQGLVRRMVRNAIGRQTIMRTFTIRSQAGDLVDVEFALHGDAGPASAWARAAQPGSVLGIVGPTPDDDFRAVQYEPSGEPDWQLFVGDDTALPAISSLLETLPASVDARVFVQVPHQRDIRDLPRAVTWTVGGGLADAVRSAELPSGTPYAWVAAEAAIVRDVRRHLCKERGLGQQSALFLGLLEGGRDRMRITTEEQLRAVVSPPHPHLRDKEIPFIDAESARFLQAATFFLLATTGADGSVDVSPRGEAAGGITVLDDKTLAFPDRPGNRRLDSLRNILQCPNVGMLFIVPGRDETVRLNGRAALYQDGDAIRVEVTVDELFLHCGQSLKRSSVWDPAGWPDPVTVPSFGAMIKSTVAARLISAA